MRAQALGKRARAASPAADTLLREHLLRELTALPGAVVAAVWPLPGEPDLRPLLDALHTAGRQVLLPETTPRGESLLFHCWTPGCAMQAGRFGTQAPDGPVATPDIVLVPLLAFDRRGARLGYGGGYYDRTLANLPQCVRVGFGYAAQQVETVPVEPHDRTLDMVVTEHGVAWCRAAMISDG